MTNAASIGLLRDQHALGDLLIVLAEELAGALGLRLEPTLRRRDDLLDLEQLAFEFSAVLSRF